MKTLLLLLLLVVGSYGSAIIRYTRTPFNHVFHNPPCPPGWELGPDGKCVPKTHGFVSDKTVSGGEVCIPDCPEGSHCKDGKCESVSRSFASTICRPGQILVEGRCVGGSNRLPPCPPGSVRLETGCISFPRQFAQIYCPPGMHFNHHGICVPDWIQDFKMRSCDLGEIDMGGRCIPGILTPRNFDEKPCPPGMIMGANGVCVKKPSSFDFDGFNQNPCPPGQVRVGGRCVGRRDRFYFGTCTDSLECPDNRKCVNGVCLAV